MNILVIKHGALGDFVQALGAMRAIRTHHKNDHITLLTTKAFAELAKASGYVDAVHIDARPKWYQVLKLAALRDFLNKGSFRQIYDLQNSDRSYFYSILFRHSPAWNGARWKAGHPLKSVHVFNALRAQLGLAGINDVTFDDLSWIKGTAHLNLPKPYVLVAAGSSPTRKEKRWPPDRFASLCRWLIEKNYTPVLLGTADEADVNAQILKSCPAAIDLSGKTTLFDIPELARDAAASVGNDTGPMQMIGPTGCKTLALYPGFSNPVRHGPLGARVKTLQKQTLADIGVEDVKDAMMTLLT